MDAYVRVSRVGNREGASYISPSVQREQIEGWAKLRGVEIAEWHEDFDQSGGKLERPGLTALLERIESGQTEGVVVAKLDRLSRLGVGDALKLVEQITGAGASLAAVDLGLDPTTPFGEFGLTIMLAMARMERRRLADSWAIAQQRAVERGVKVTKAPYGYIRRADSTLEVDPVKGAHIRRAYQLAASQGISAAARYLSAHAPGRRWTTATTRRALKSRTYLGESQHGENVNPEAHEALVDRQVWEAAQQAPRTYVRTSAKYPLSGIAVCGSCGAPMTAGPASNNSGKRRYRCSAAQTLYRGPRCELPASIDAEVLETHLRERLEPILATVTLSVADGSDELALAERALNEAEAELEAFASDLALRRALGARYAEHRASRIRNVEAARETYRRLGRAASARERIDGVPEDDLMLAELLRSIDVSIVVARGRAPASERVRVLPFDD